MRIVQETLDNEIFLEVLFDKKDIEHVTEYMIPSAQIELEGKTLNVGIRLELPELIESYKN